MKPTGGFPPIRNKHKPVIPINTANALQTVNIIDIDDLLGF